MIKIRSPISKKVERNYIYATLVGDFLGLDYSVVFENRNDICIECAQGKIHISDIFLSQADEDWLTKRSLPDDKPTFAQIPEQLHTSVTTVPVVFGSTHIYLSERAAHCGIDIFGSSFFLLTRYEEYIIDKRDSHDRYASDERYLIKSKLAKRPIVNEYIEILRQMIFHYDASIVFNRKKFNVHLSHDVDCLYEYYLLSFTSALRLSLAALIKRFEMKRFFSILTDWFIAKVTQGRRDPANTIQYLMSCSEQRGLKSRFYFIADPDKTGRCFSKPYSIAEPASKNIIESIINRGHEVGFHGTYDSYKNYALLTKEIQILQNVCREFQPSYTIEGGRQHYLRLKLPETLANLEAAGVTYDSTVAFSDAIGFPTSCCYPHKLFDPISRRTIELLQYPLMFMDTILSNTDSPEKSKRLLEDAIDVKRQCEHYNGTFVMLWHNSNLKNKRQRALYLKLLDS